MLIALVTLSNASLALGQIGNLTEIALLPHRNIVARFYQSLDVPAPLGRSDRIEELLYGNDKYGYFETDDFMVTSTPSGVRLKIHLIPPGYRYPISIWIKSQGKVVPVAKNLSFVSPVTGVLQEFEAKVVEGSVNRANYFIIGGAFPAVSSASGLLPTHDDGEDSATNFVSIINRYGEVVWLNFPGKGKPAGSGYIVAKPAPEGSIAILVSSRSGGYFEILNSHGEVIKSIAAKDQPLNFSMHHDFILSANTLVTFSDNMKYLRDPRRLWSTMEPYRGDRVVAIDLETVRVRPLWDMFSWFHPITERPDDFAPDKMFNRLHVKPVKKDFGHANSIDFHPVHGWLISPRDFNGFLLYDSGFTKLKWRVGSDERASHPFEDGQSIFQQHHASFLENGNVMLFDNGKSASRVVEVKVDSKAAKIIWAFAPEPPIHSRIHGSAYLVDGRSVFAFFPDSKTRQTIRHHPPASRDGTSGKEKVRDYIFEVDYPSGKVLARIELKLLSPHGSYRAYPMLSLGKSRFLGTEHVAH